MISQSWATTTMHTACFPKGPEAEPLQWRERETQWWAHARSFITKRCFARDGDACKQRTRHFRTTTHGHIRHWWILWTAAALSFAGSAWLKAGAEQNAQFPRLSSNYLERLIFFLGFLYLDIEDIVWKWDSIIFYKNPERTALSIKKLFSLVTF